MAEGLLFPASRTNLFDHDNTRPINRVREQEHLEVFGSVL